MKPDRRRLRLAIVLTFALMAAASAAPRPNFLLIVADDLGCGDVSTHGASDVRTPHLEQLAAEGMLFTAMRSNSTVCSPTRAALLTGRHPDRVGVPGVIRTDPADSWGFFDPSVPTLADELRAAGYATGLVGKWHLGLASPNTPNERGFDHFHGFLGDMMDSHTDHLRHGQNYLRLNGQEVAAEGHSTDLFTDWACACLRGRAAARDQPFFLYLAYTAPHFPIEPPADWLSKVRQRLPALEEKRARAIAFVEHLDDAVGRVLNTLRDAGLAGDTLVAFTSDNGGSLPHAQNNDPWRGGKQSHYDGGLRVPFLVRWPGRTAAGARSEYAGQVFDVFPTFLEAAGVAAPAGIDAVSLMPILRGGSIETARDLYFVRREGGAAYGGKSYEALIRGEWKLLQNDPYSPLELYNLRDDPQEKTSLAASRGEVLREMAAALRGHIRRAGSVPWQPPAPGR
jgi:arylsulfatase A-like enzyme